MRAPGRWNEKSRTTILMPGSWDEGDKEVSSALQLLSRCGRSRGGDRGGVRVLPDRCDPSFFVPARKI